MSEPLEVIGVHVSQLPGAIPDVWPIVDESGVVVRLVRTWDDAAYVRLGEDGAPVDEIGSTHHLMPRAVFKTTVLPEEWEYVAARRVSRGLKQLGNPFAVAEAFGDGRELETLVELNAGAGRLIDTIDTCPPFTHVIELNGEFFVVEKRAAASQDAAEVMVDQIDAEPLVPEPVAGPLAPETAAPAKPVVEPSAEVEAAMPVSGTPPPDPVGESPQETPDRIAEQVFAAAAVEAAMVPDGAEVAVPDVVVDDELPSMTSTMPKAAASASPRPSAPVARASDLLQAVAMPDADDPEVDERPDLDANMARGGGLASEIDEGIWDDGDFGAPAQLSAGPPRSTSPTLMSEMPEDEDLESMRAASYAQATEFLRSASTQPVSASDRVLTLEQVRLADCFAWDEFMNLYLPHVGFVAALLAGTPAADAPAEIVFAPRPEADARPVGWHHLTGCGCRFCQA